MARHGSDPEARTSCSQLPTVLPDTENRSSGIGMRGRRTPLDLQLLNPLTRSILLELEQFNDVKHSTHTYDESPAPKKLKILPSTATEVSSEGWKNDLLSAISKSSIYKLSNQIEIFEDHWNFNPNIKDKSIDEKDAHVCISCKRKFSTYNDLRSHIIQIHTPGLYVQSYFECGDCSVKSEFLDDLRIHYTIYHARDLLQQEIQNCSLCPATFIKDQDQLLICHKIVSHFLKYKCRICGVSNLKPAEVYQHILDHRKFPDMFRSARCDFMSYDKSTVFSHQVEHVSKNCYICHCCSKIFNTPDELQMHLLMRPHETCQAIHSCRVCGLKTLDSNLLICHSEKEKKYNNFLYRCFNCCRRFASEPKLLAHKNGCKQGRAVPFELFMPPLSPLLTPIKKLVIPPPTNRLKEVKPAASKTCTKLEDEPHISGLKITKIIDPPIGNSEASSIQEEPNELKEAYINLLKMKKWDVKLALIYDVEEERCKICKIPISCDAEIQAHFKTHFTPCCSGCKPNDKPCEEHKRPHFRHAENYYMKLSQHKLKTLEVEEKSMTYCTLCGFVTSSACEKNILKGRYFQCPECGASHHSREELVVHLLSHLAFFICQTCHLQIQGINEVYQHMVSHENSQSFMCMHCGRVFESDNSLIKHIRGCSKNVVKRMAKAANKSSSLYCQLEDMFVKAKSCIQCDLEFVSEERLQKHLSSHPCLICPICCAPAKSMLSHCQKFHQSIFKANDESLTSLTNLKASINYANINVMTLLLPYSIIPQMQYKANLIKNKKQCRVCQMHCIGEKDIEAHFRIHLTPCCRSCNIPQRTSCDSHQRLNFQHPENYFVNFSCHRFTNSSNGRSYKCLDCPSTFEMATEIHIISTYFSTSFRCDECSNDRLKERDLFFHVMGHLVTKSCNFCDFSSSSSEKIREHVCSAHGGIQCGWCANKTFLLSEHKKHLKVCMQGLLSYIQKTSTRAYQLKDNFLYCDLCEMMFANDSCKHEHDKKFHLVPLCPFCGQKCPNLREHVTEKHWKLISIHESKKSEPFIISTLKLRVNTIKTQISSIYVRKIFL